MKRAGIVCELNPMHNGHIHLIEAVRAAGAEEVVCVMSSYFVQRCEPACIPHPYRAVAAVYGGADAVFELPFPYSCASAEFFARAAVYILAKLGCDTLAFGSECGSLGTLMQYASEPKEKPGKEQGSACAQRRLEPNNILAVEYIRAARALGCPIDFFTVRREGSSHANCGIDEAAVYPSSGALRARMKEGSPLSGISVSMAEQYGLAQAKGSAPVFSRDLGNALFSFWRVSDPATLSVFAECGGGVSGRLHKASLDAVNYEEMMSLAATKKYTDARLRRAVLYAFLGIKESDLKELPASARLLAMNSTGRKILSSLPPDGGLPVVTKVRDFPGNVIALRQMQLESRAEALYTSLLPVPLKAGSLYCLSAIVIKNKD